MFYKWPTMRGHVVRNTRGSPLKYSHHTLHIPVPASSTLTPLLCLSSPKCEKAKKPTKPGGKKKSGVGTIQWLPLRPVETTPCSARELFASSYPPQRRRPYISTVFSAVNRWGRPYVTRSASLRTSSPQRPLEEEAPRQQRTRLSRTRLRKWRSQRSR
jgi:hypothetical protein